MAEPLERHVQRNAGVGRNAESIAANSSVPTFGHKATAPSASESLGSCKQGRGVRAGLRAQPLASRAPTQRTVEREAVRSKLLEAAAAAIAGIVLAVDFGAPARLGHVGIRVCHVHDTLAERQRVFHRVGDAAASIGTHVDPIDHNFDQMLAAAVDLRQFVERVRLAVDPYSHVAEPADFGPDVFVFLANFDFERGHQVQLCAGRLGQNLIDDFVRRLGADWDVAIRAKGRSEPGHQDAGSRRFP